MSAARPPTLRCRIVSNRYRIVFCEPRPSAGMPDCDENVSIAASSLARSLVRSCAYFVLPVKVTAARSPGRISSTIARAISLPVLTIHRSENGALTSSSTMMKMRGSPTWLSRTSAATSRVHGASVWSTGGRTIGSKATRGCSTPSTRTVKSSCFKSRMGRRFLSRTVTSRRTTSTDDRKVGTCGCCAARVDRDNRRRDENCPDEDACSTDHRTLRCRLAAPTS